VIYILALIRMQAGSHCCQFDDDNNKERISVFSRDIFTVENDNTTWRAVDRLLSMGTTSIYFALSTYVLRRKLFTAKGLRVFLQRSRNLKTLAFSNVFLDTECCQLLGRTSHSPLSLSVTICMLENPGVLGDGMRQDGGPTELIVYGAGSRNSDILISLGPLKLNTKLESLIMKGFLCFNEEKMEAFLLTLCARGLRKVVFEFAHR
jgi:hypothetical protein